MNKTFIALLVLSTIGSVRADLTVFAAASTTDVMRELAQELKKDSGGILHSPINCFSCETIPRRLQYAQKAGSESDNSAGSEKS